MIDTTPDDLDLFVAESKDNREFTRALELARHRREVMHELREKRKEAGLSRTTVANRMGTSEAAVARLESGLTDPR